MINHVVLMKFKPGVCDADIEALERILDALPNIITEIHTYEFGRDLVHSPSSYDFALTALFANLEALNRYQNHPQHLPVLKTMQEICESVATVDFEGPKAEPIDIAKGNA